MVKGTQRAESKEFSKHVGFALVSVVSINPSREEINKLVGKDDADDDKVVEYVGETQDGETKARLSFWLKEEKTGRLFVHNISIIDKEKKNKDGDKNQWINNVGITTWVDEEANLPEWFTKFTDKEKNVLGKKTYIKASPGQEELGIFMRTWLGKLNFNLPDADISIDRKKLFAGNFKELKSLIGEEFTTPLVVLLGVRTDKEDSTKQYQQVYSKGFLPAQFMKYINNNNSFPTEYTQRIWNKFTEDAQGQYGFNAFFKLSPLSEYDRAEDLAASEETKPTVTAENADY